MATPALCARRATGRGSAVAYGFLDLPEPIEWGNVEWVRIRPDGEEEPR